VLYRLAERLDYSAWLGIFLFTVLGAGIGWSAGTTLGQPLLHGDNESVSRYQLFATIIFGAVGYWLGSERAFRLRILMHTILCQVQIEENTRAPERRGDRARLLVEANQLCVDDPKATAIAADEFRAAVAEAAEWQFEFPGRIRDLPALQELVVITSRRRRVGTFPPPPPARRPSRICTLHLKNGDKVTGMVDGPRNGVYIVVTSSGTLTIAQANVAGVTPKGSRS